MCLLFFGCAKGNAAAFRPAKGDVALARGIEEEIMDFGLEAGIFLIYAACLLAVCFFGRLLLKPIKFMGRLMLNSLIGGAALLVLNGIGGSFGLFVPLNIITAAVTGIAGVPGLAALLIYFRFI